MDMHFITTALPIMEDATICSKIDHLNIENWVDDFLIKLASFTTLKIISMSCLLPRLTSLLGCLTQRFCALNVCPHPSCLGNVITVCSGEKRNILIGFAMQEHPSNWQKQESPISFGTSV